MNGDREIIRLEISFQGEGKKNGRERSFGKISNDLSWSESLSFFFIFKVAATQRDLDLTSADAQTKSNSARYVTGFVTDFACPVFSKGHHHRWWQPSPPLEFILV